jgi:putative ABC transport system substrate-binding protein
VILFWISDFGFWIGKSSSKKVFCLTLCAWLFTLCFLAEAQQHTNVAKIGWLGARSFGSDERQRSGAELFVAEFSKLGYVDGKNITIEYRYADDNFDRLPALADDLVRLKVNLLLAAATREALAAKTATRTIPIIFFGVPDPVASGLVDSLARPGGNITGFTSISAVLAQQAIRVAQGNHSESVPRSGALESREFSLCGAMESKPTVVTTIRITARNRLPAIYTRRDFVETTGLMSYGPDRSEPFRRAALMADKILKGTKPADLPVEQPTKFELAINLKAAKQIGLTIPPNVLARADRVIR